MGTDIEGTVLTIVTCARALKALGEGGGRAARDRDVEEASGGRDDRMIISKLHDERTINVDSIFIKAIFGVDSGEGGRSVRRSWG